MQAPSQDRYAIATLRWPWRARYGIEGVLADSINQVCGVEPEDFALMTNGIASSSCTIPVRNFGEIVSVFGHEHEIGRSIRLTLNAGRTNERILLDIPDWSFDWQYNYYLVESVILERGDTVLLECSWDRSRRTSALEPAYILWADGTNDEMCFATIATRRLDEDRTTDSAVSDIDRGGLDIVIPAELTACLNEAGVSIDGPVERDLIDAAVAALFDCADPGAIGELLSSLVSTNFDGLVGADGARCLAERLASPAGAHDLLVFVLDDATNTEKRPIGELVGDCVLLSEALAVFGFPLPESAHACVNDAGRDLLVQATIEAELPEEQTLFRAINPCLQPAD